MNTLKAMVGAALIFFLGLGLGGAGAWHVLGNRMAAYKAQEVSEREHLILARLTDRLDLSPEQQVRIGEILKENREQRRQVVLASVEDGSEAIRKELTEEQQKTYDRMVRRLKKIMRVRQSP